MPKAKKKKEDRIDPDDMRATVKADDKYKTFRRIVKNLSQEIDIEKMHEEILRLHSGRKSRGLYLKRPSVDAVVEAALQDSAYRSRIAEIRVEASYNLGLLEETVDKIRKHLMREFRDTLTDLRTKGERMAFADQYLDSGLSLMGKIGRLVNTADSIIKDIDQSGFSYKHVVDSLSILYSSKNDKKNV